MTSKVENNTNFINVNFAKDEAPGLCVVVRGFNESIMKEALVMAQVCDALDELSKFLRNISTQIEQSSTGQAKTEKALSTVTSITSALSVLGVCSLVGFTAIEEGVEPSIMQTIHGFIEKKGPKLIVSGQIGSEVVGGYYSFQKGKYSSGASELQGVYAQLSPVTDSYTQANDSCSKSISSKTKTIKEMLQYDFSTKKKGLYYKK